MAKFRKKPVVIEAIQYDGTENSVVEILDFSYTKPNAIRVSGGDLFVRTLEGSMKAIKGDWIIKEIQGEFYPCKPDIFEQTYELIIEGEEPNEYSALQDMGGT